MTIKMKTSKSIAVVFLLFITFLIMGSTDLNHFRDDSIAQLKARLSSLEQRVEELENKLSGYIGCGEVFVVPSARLGLKLILDGLKLKVVKLGENGT